jgi:hypothetical protein
MNRKISIVIEKDESGYYAYCPELLSCQSQGNTVELYLETLSSEEVESYFSRQAELDRQALPSRAW